jgi:hypothetical protein
MHNMRWFGRPYMAMAPRFVIPTCSTSFTISLSLFSSGQLRLLSLSLNPFLFTPPQTQFQYKNLPLTFFNSLSVTVLDGSSFK